MLIELKEASKIYKSGEMEVRALNEVSLQIEQNCYLAIIGPSGCGKSTLLNVIAGFEQLDQGEYRFLGQDSRDNKSELKRVTAMIFQDHQLLEYLSIRDNLLLPSLYGAKREDPQHSQAILKQLGVDALLKRYPSQLSGGERQRCGIARALLYRKRLILADEPTGSLDRANSEEIMKIFDLLHEQGCSIILVTHDQKLADHCHRKLVMEDGRVID